MPELVTKEFVCAQKCIGVVNESVGTQKYMLRSENKTSIDE